MYYYYDKVSKQYKPNKGAKIVRQISCCKKIMLLVSILFILACFKGIIPELEGIKIQNNKLWDENKIENTSIWSIITKEPMDIYIQVAQRIYEASNKRDKGRYMGNFFAPIIHTQAVEIENLIYIRYLIALGMVLIFYKIIEYIYHKDGPRSKIPSSN